MSFICTLVKTMTTFSRPVQPTEGGSGRTITTIIIIIIILIRIIMITRPIQPTQSMRIMVVDKPSTAAFRASPKLLIERYRCTCSQ